MVFDKKAYDKQWVIDNPNKQKIKAWRNRGLISNDYDSIYTRWKNSTTGEKCGHDYSYYKKHMDHCHKTGEFRSILCHRCNTNNKVTNKSGYPNISYHKSHKLWIYSQYCKKVKYRKSFKTKNEAIIYKWLYEAGYSIET
jgi:hypothetical protein